MDESGVRPRQPWPDAVRDLAEDLARDRGRSAPAIRDAVREELGADVPLETIQRWAKDLRRREPIDRASVLRDVADRAACLLSAEIERIERQTPKSRDLARIDSVAKTLKTLASIEPSKAGSGRQTLQSVARDDASDERPEASSHRTEPNPAAQRTAA